MVLLDYLNSICSKRTVAQSRPSQILCRLLGNTYKVCVLDPICLPVEKKGICFFYSVLGIAAVFVFVSIFWLLRVTRLSKLLNLVSRVVLPPFKWLVSLGIHLKNFYDGLPF